LTLVQPHYYYYYYSLPLRRPTKVTQHRMSTHLTTFITVLILKIYDAILVAICSLLGGRRPKKFDEDGNSECCNGMKDEVSVDEGLDEGLDRHTPQAKLCY
jgi:hypothetical protein